MEKLTFRLRSVTAMLMHSGRLANPLDPIARQMKEITSKQKKTDDDYEKLAHLEWRGGLYIDREGSPCIPGELIEAALAQAGKKVRKGKEFLIGTQSDGNWPLEYEGPKKADELWGYKNGAFVDTRSARVKGSRVMRTRPIFRKWEATVEVEFDPTQINLAHVVNAMHEMGRMGLMDYRPKFGRFEVVDGNQ